MTQEMRILGWEAHGLRCPDHYINCADIDGNVYPVSLIQMPNGTGKTTTLTLLRAALSGAADKGRWNGNAVTTFRKKDGAEAEGLFEVRLLLNDRRVTVTMLFDFDTSSITYRTTHGHGNREGFHPPTGFKRFMNENFVNFYVFDGELAQHLLDKEHADAESVVEGLFQLELFTKMENRVSEYWDKNARSGPTEERGLKRRQNRVADLRERLTKLSREQSEFQAKFKLLTEQLSHKRQIYQNEIEKVQERAQELAAAEKLLDETRSRVRETALDTLENMRDPHALSSAFADSMIALKDGLDRVKLPASAAREFFEDLALEAECICGRSIDSKIADEIRNRADHYLGSEAVSLLNAMKTSIRDNIGDNPTDGAKQLEQQVSALASAMRKHRESATSLDDLRIVAQSSDPAVRRAQSDIETLQAQMEAVERELEKFDSIDETQRDEHTHGIGVVQKRLRTAEDKLAEITHTLTEKKKRDILTKIFRNAHNKARHAMSRELCGQANDRIEKLMPNNNIMIDQVGKNLILAGQEGSSAGETLSIAYAFLATLFNRADRQLPFVVDSPAGPIDLAVRPRIGALIPHLSEQFIAFTISSERERFIDALRCSGGRKVQFMTVFRKGVRDLDQAAHNSGVAQETFDGLIVEGEQFFESFQLDSESAD